MPSFVCSFSNKETHIPFEVLGVRPHVVREFYDRYSSALLILICLYNEYICFMSIVANCLTILVHLLLFNYVFTSKVLDLFVIYCIVAFFVYLIGLGFVFSVCILHKLLPPLRLYHFVVWQSRTNLTRSKSCWFFVFAHFKNSLLCFVSNFHFIHSCRHRLF